MALGRVVLVTALAMLAWPAVAQSPMQVIPGQQTCPGGGAPCTFAPFSPTTPQPPQPPLQASFTDRSGSITLGGTAQTLAAINTARKRILIENPCTATSQGIATAESLFINFTSAAAANSTSIELTSCGSYDSGPGPVTTELISVIAPTTAHKWVAKEQ